LIWDVTDEGKKSCLVFLFVLRPDYLVILVFVVDDGEHAILDCEDAPFPFIDLWDTESESELTILPLTLLEFLVLEV
jgi:hypothetical protein